MTSGLLVPIETELATRNGKNYHVVCVEIIERGTGHVYFISKRPGKYVNPYAPSEQVLTTIDIKHPTYQNENNVMDEEMANNQSSMLDDKEIDEEMKSFLGAIILHGKPPKA